MEEQAEAGNHKTMSDFLTTEEEQRVVEAIKRAEAGTRGEIRVCITYRWVWNPERYARKLFHRFGMQATRERNAALILVFPPPPPLRLVRR